MRRVIVVAALLVSTSAALAASAQARQALQRFVVQLRRDWGSAYVSRVRLNPSDDSMVNIYANRRWHGLSAFQKRNLGLKWWYRWAKLRSDARYVVVDVKTSNGYPLLHCYGEPWKSGTCR